MFAETFRIEHTKVTKLEKKDVVKLCTSMVRYNCISYGMTGAPILRSKI